MKWKFEEFWGRDEWIFDKVKFDSGTDVLNNQGERRN